MLVIHKTPIFEKKCVADITRKQQQKNNDKFLLKLTVPNTFDHFTLQDIKYYTIDLCIMGDLQNRSNSNRKNFCR